MMLKMKSVIDFSYPLSFDSHVLVAKILPPHDEVRYSSFLNSEE